MTTFPFTEDFFKVCFGKIQLFDRESNLARSYKFENCCCCCWGHFAQVPIYYEQFNYFMNSQNIGMIHKILEKFTKYWKNSQNVLTHGHALKAF